jgi:hypothetical protein
VGIPDGLARLAVARLEAIWQRGVECGSGSDSFSRFQDRERNYSLVDNTVAG